MITGNTSKIKARKYTFSLSKEEQWQTAIDFCESCPGFAYIKHDKDEGSVHYHFYVEFPNPRSLHAIAQELDVPDNMIEKVRTPQGLLKYLTHTDDKSVKAGKHAYSKDEIETNLPDSAFDYVDASKAYDEIRDALDDYFAGHLSYRQITTKLKPYILSGSLPTSIVRQLTDLRKYALTTSDDFAHIPVEEYDEETRNRSLSTVPSSVFQAMFPFGRRNE